MNTTTFFMRPGVVLGCLALGLFGCDPETPKTTTNTDPTLQLPTSRPVAKATVSQAGGPVAQEEPPPVGALPQPGCGVPQEPEPPPDPDKIANEKLPTPKTELDGKLVPVNKNVWLEILPGDKRRVLVQARVWRRQGQLEQLLCKFKTKEHETILSADVDARNIHLALTLAKAEAGNTVEFFPKYKAASGTTIKISLQYTEKDKLKTVPAQTWVRHMDTKKDLHYNWVFAGSRFFNNALNKDVPPFFAANQGDIICVSNFDTALLDLPVSSSAEDGALAFEAHTARIPPLLTPVIVILEPVLPAKK